MFFRTGSTGSTSFFCGRLTRYSNRLHDFSVTIPRCYKDVYINRFFPHTARLRNSLPLECFPLAYNLNGFRSRFNRPINWRFFVKRFPVCFNLFVLLFLLTPCLVVVVQSCMEGIPNEKKKIGAFAKCRSCIQILDMGLAHFEDSKIENINFLKAWH